MAHSLRSSRTTASPFDMTSGTIESGGGKKHIKEAAMIRMMQDTDAPLLAQLFQKGRRQAFHWVEPSLFQLSDFAEQTQGEQIWVAEQGGTPCGFISIWGADSFVHHLYVAPDWHGQGLGRALLAQGLAGCGKPASLKVAQRNTAALAFYHRLGWQNTDETGECEITGPWRRLILE